MRYLLIAAMLLGAGTGWAGEPYLIDNVMIGDTYPAFRMCTITFDGDNGATATIDWCDGKIKYEGDMPVEESARKFFDAFPEACADMVTHWPSLKK